MASDAVTNILNQRRDGPQEAVVAGEKFYSYIIGDSAVLPVFFEVKQANGTRACFRYDGLEWFFFAPDENRIVLTFDSARIFIMGRGLNGKLFTGFQQKRIAWVKEKDSDFQDNPDNECYIEEISISPFDEEEPEES